MCLVDMAELIVVCLLGAVLKVDITGAVNKKGWLHVLDCK